LADTHAGGALFWVVGELVTLTALGVQLVQWMHDEERAAVRADRRLDAALAAEQAGQEVDQPGITVDQAALVRDVRSTTGTHLTTASE